ncbi:hypothetical protein IW262DRAFT_1416354 [Armillaria fumosa]|nr:hypothetical protein IW262DRAFT_1416354 [Armillaria fumosa]
MVVISISAPLLRLFASMYSSRVSAYGGEKVHVKREFHQPVCNSRGQETWVHSFSCCTRVHFNFFSLICASKGLEVALPTSMTKSRIDSIPLTSGELQLLLLAYSAFILNHTQLDQEECTQWLLWDFSYNRHPNEDTGPRKLIEIT